MKFFQIFICSLLINVSVSAQQISDITKVEDGQKIAQKLFNSLGIEGTCPPVIYESNEKYAMTRNGKIYICPERVVRKLITFGDKADDALAAIIGHEMWHFYKKQESHFYASWENSTKIKSEKEADLYGLMLAYFAGYKDVLLIYDQIFDVLKIPPSDSNSYPDINTRKASDEYIKEQAREIVGVYDAGHIFLSNGSSPFCKMAIECYRHCGEKMLYLKEINYQIGLAYLKYGLNERGMNQYWLPLPFQQNPYKGDISAKKDDPLGRVLLDSARHYFQLAINQNPRYMDARFGELCARVMMNSSEANILSDFSRQEIPLDPMRLALLEATAGLFQEETKDNSIRELEALAESKEDDIGQYAQANLALAKGKIPPSDNCPDLKIIDDIQHKVTQNPNVFAYEELLLPSDDCYFSTDPSRKKLSNSSLFMWRSHENMCILQFLQEYPFKSDQISKLNPAIHPAGTWYYCKKDEYDILVRPKETEPEKMECIKIIHNIK